jgi:hypothetical protein
MSTKFEQLLDYLVNEEMDKANELFHEIVVEKSRSIYENLIAEEVDEEMDEEVDEEMDEEVDEEMDESQEDLEDSYRMDAEEDDGFGGGEKGDATDALGAEIGMDADSEEGEEASEDSAMMDIKNAIEELEAAFAELEQAQGGEHDDMDSEFGDEEDGGEEDDMEMMGMGNNMPMENRRITREYREKVGNDWDKNSQKTQGQNLGANTGESMSAPVEGKSAVSSGKGKPVTGADAKNLNQGAVEGQSNTGTSPNKVNKGITPEKSEQYTKGVEKNISGSSTAKMMDGAKLNKQGSGYPNNNKTPGPVGSGTGDKAGQTSISSDKPFLKKL